MVSSSSSAERSLRSWSLRASSAASSEMPAFLKQFLTVVSDYLSNCMTSIIDVVGKPFFASTALMSRWMIFRRYFALRDLITPLSTYWVFEVVLGGRNISSTAFKPSILGCAGQLSTMRAAFRFSLSNVLSSSFTHSSKRKPSIQLFA